MRISRSILPATCLLTPLMALLMPAPAFAQPVSGPYIAGGLGLHAPQNPDVTAYGTGFGTGHFKLDETYGYNANLAAGYGLGNGFRFEVEGDFMHSGVQKLDGTPFPTSGDGTVRTWGVMVNALFDMDIGYSWVYPYLGLGAGYQSTKLDSVTATGPGFVMHTSDHDGAFAWQAIVGASFPIASVRGLSLTADYRFMDILGGGQYAAVTDVGAGPEPARLKLHNQLDHELVFGVRYAFDTPAPPPPPAAMPAPIAAPAPAPARSYLVFFDWDRADLTDRARQIVKEAADNSTRVQLTRIEVNGYTDTSGSAEYNMGLSMRRAQAVAGELVRDGVPKNAIAIQGFGETHLLVPTGPNVREPQNRRVEIILH